MGRIRSIKPDFFLHEGLAELDVETGLPCRLAFIGLWTQCDRGGRFKWKPKRLWAAIFPYQPEVDMEGVLEELRGAGFVVRYEVKGKVYGWLPGFTEHQRPNHREAKSTIPAPPELKLGPLKGDA